MSYCHSIDVLYSCSGNSCNGNTTYTSKKVNLRHRMTHITAYRYGTPLSSPPPLPDKFENHIFKCSNKNEHATKESYFKVFVFMTVNNENKLCYQSYLFKM